MQDTIKKIKEFIEDTCSRVGFSKETDHSPILGFKISNYDTKTDDSFKVGSLDEAEQIVTSFISTAQKGEIFTNDLYQEDKDLFLRVKTVLPKPL